MTDQAYNFSDFYFSTAFAITDSNGNSAIIGLKNYWAANGSFQGESFQIFSVKIVVIIQV